MAEDRNCSAPERIGRSGLEKAEEIVDRYGGSFAEQVHLTLKNIKGILAGAGLTLAHLVKVTVYLSDLSRVEEFNAIYSAEVPEPRPARTLVQAGLRNIDVEMDVIAADSHHPLFK